MKIKAFLAGKKPIKNPQKSHAGFSISGRIGTPGPATTERRISVGTSRLVLITSKKTPKPV